MSWFYFKKTREIYFKMIRELFEVNRWVTSKSLGKSCKIRQGMEFRACLERPDELKLLQKDPWNLLQKTRQNNKLFEVNHWVTSKSLGKSCKIRQGMEFWACLERPAEIATSSTHESFNNTYQGPTCGPGEALRPEKTRSSRSASFSRLWIEFAGPPVHFIAAGGEWELWWWSAVGFAHRQHPGAPGI